MMREWRSRAAAHALKACSPPGVSPVAQIAGAGGLRAREPANSKDAGEVGTFNEDSTFAQQRVGADATNAEASLLEKSVAQAAKQLADEDEERGEARA